MVSVLAVFLDRFCEKDSIVLVVVMPTFRQRFVRDKPNRHLLLSIARRKRNLPEGLRKYLQEKSGRFIR